MRTTALIVTALILVTPAAVLVATERLSPDAIAASTNYTGTVADIQDDPDAPDASFLNVTAVATTSGVRVTFPMPSGPPTVGAGPPRVPRARPPALNVCECPPFVCEDDEEPNFQTCTCDKP